MEMGENMINAVLSKLDEPSRAASRSLNSLSILFILLYKYSEVIAKLHSKANVREVMHIVNAMQHLSKAYEYALNMQGEVE